MISRLLIIVMCCALLALVQFIDGFNQILLPFLPLDSKLKLHTYVGYSMLVMGPIFFLWIIGLMIYQLFHPKRCKYSYHRSSMLAMKVILAVGVLAVFPRAYFGHKITQANYVECVEEANYSARSSWRVYAKDISLCEKDK